MKICIIACDNKKETAASLCAEYCGTLCRHSVSAGPNLIPAIEESAGISVNPLLDWGDGCTEQVTQLVACGEADMVICLRDPSPSAGLSKETAALSSACDFYGIPLATGTATAEILLHSLKGRENTAFLNRLSKTHR